MKKPIRSSSTSGERSPALSPDSISDKSIVCSPLHGLAHYPCEGPVDRARKRCVRLALMDAIRDGPRTFLNHAHTPIRKRWTLWCDRPSWCTNRPLRRSSSRRKCPHCGVRPLHRGHSDDILSFSRREGTDSYTVAGSPLAYHASPRLYDNASHFHVKGLVSQRTSSEGARKVASQYLVAHNYGPSRRRT